MDVISRIESVRESLYCLLGYFSDTVEVCGLVKELAGPEISDAKSMSLSAVVLNFVMSPDNKVMSCVWLNSGVPGIRPRYYSRKFTLEQFEAVAIAIEQMHDRLHRSPLEFSFWEGIIFGVRVNVDGGLPKDTWLISALEKSETVMTVGPDTFDRLRRLRLGDKEIPVIVRAIRETEEESFNHFGVRAFKSFSFFEGTQLRYSFMSDCSLNLLRD